MKRTILAVLMVTLIATPCFAQEVEPEGLFSIDGTEWRALPIGLLLFPIPLLPLPVLGEVTWGFYGGEVYPQPSDPATKSFYIDMLVASIFRYEEMTSIPGNVPFTETGFGIMQPIGIGMMINYTKLNPSDSQSLPLQISMGLLIKTDNNWTPYGVE